MLVEGEQYHLQYHFVVVLVYVADSSVSLRRHAPPSRRAFTTSRWPLRAAQCSAVLPAKVTESRSTGEEKGESKCE